VEVEAEGRRSTIGHGMAERVAVSPVEAAKA